VFVKLEDMGPCVSNARQGIIPIDWVKNNAICVLRGNTSKLSMQLVLFVVLENTKNQTINQVQVVKYVAKVLTKMKTAVHFVNFVHLERN